MKLAPPGRQKACYIRNRFIRQHQRLFRAPQWQNRASNQFRPSLSIGNIFDFLFSMPAGNVITCINNKPLNLRADLPNTSPGKHKTKKKRSLKDVLWCLQRSALELNSTSNVLERRAENAVIMMKVCILFRRGLLSSMYSSHFAVNPVHQGAWLSTAHSVANDELNYAFVLEQCWTIGISFGMNGFII